MLAERAFWQSASVRSRSVSYVVAKLIDELRYDIALALAARLADDRQRRGAKVR
jgi:hypothetical protein